MHFPQIDERAIAARLRGLIGATSADDYAFSARRLGVGEVTLRMSADELDPHPTFEVLAAVIRVYGVDPAWLITGAYDPQAHRVTLDASDEHRITQVLSDLLSADPRGPIAGNSCFEA